MTDFRRKWRDYWFAPAGPENLAICRILFYGSFFLFYLGRDFSAWADVSKAFWMPIWLYRWLPFEALSGDPIAVLQVVWKTALAFSCIGLFAPVAAIVSFILGAGLLGLANNFGMTNHSDGLVTIVLLILAMSRAWDRWSVDRLIARAVRGRAHAAPAASGEYTWPVRAVWMMFSLIFLAAGIAKLRRAGLEWVTSDTMSILLINHHYNTAQPGYLWPIGLQVASDHVLSKMLAAATLALELGYPLTLVSLRARWTIVPAVFVMQIGIRYLMGPVFYTFLICNLFWIPWDRVAGAIGRRPRPAATIPPTRPSPGESRRRA